MGMVLQTHSRHMNFNSGMQFIGNTCQFRRVINPRKHQPQFIATRTDRDDFSAFRQFIR